MRVATLEILQATAHEQEGSRVRCLLKVRCKGGEIQSFSEEGDSPSETIAALISQLCVRPIVFLESRSVVRSEDVEPSEPEPVQSTLNKQYIVAVEEHTPRSDETKRAGVGRFVATEEAKGLILAALRAASNAGLLKAAYRANNQKFLRSIAKELVDEQQTAWGLDRLTGIARLEAEAIALEHLNQAASAAVVTAANHPKADSILSLFDTSAWLFDRQGTRRDSYTDTELWLAWYPGVENNNLNLGDVIETMPVTPDIKIPWIVRVFENPEGWIRFRGAVHLEDHDVLHVLLGRGLQDQDEAFVVGFAMGTAKKKSTIQSRLLRFALTYLYPEPYRIPKYLQPAFNLGFECGMETGSKDLYKRSLSELRSLSLGEARQEAEIDMEVVLRYYEMEQQKIPFTIASLRLP